MTDETQNEEIGTVDPDVPIDEKLLMEEGNNDAADQDEEIDKNDLAKIAGQEDADDGKTEDEHIERAVPQARFNQVYAENKTLKEQLAVLENSQTQDQQQETLIDIKAMRRQATAALLEGDSDKHDEIQDQIFDELMKRADTQAENRITQRTEAANFKDKVSELVNTYPVLNPNGGDQEAIDLVVELRDSYIAKGMSMTEALDKAAHKIAPRFAPAASNDTPPDELLDARKQAAVRRGVETNNAIPPKSVGVGNRAIPAKDNNDIPQAEWETMSAAARQKHLEMAG